VNDKRRPRFGERCSSSGSALLPPLLLLVLLLMVLFYCCCCTTSPRSRKLAGNDPSKGVGARPHAQHKKMPGMHHESSV
jgi:hypothetical protein